MLKGALAAGPLLQFFDLLVHFTSSRSTSWIVFLPDQFEPWCCPFNLQYVGNDTQWVCSFLHLAHTIYNRIKLFSNPIGNPRCC